MNNEMEKEELLTYDEMELNTMLKVSSKVKLKNSLIDIENIVISNMKKYSRKDTIIGLTGLVSEYGVVSPIHVLQLEDEDSYLLLDGLRRIYSALRNGIKQINAVVWDFEDKVEGKKKANVLSLILNRSQKFSNKELWEQLKTLEEVDGLSPSMIEFLLGMNSGDAMKMKDVMLADEDYSEIKDKLITGELTIDGAYKKLCNERRKENRLQKEDKTVIESISDEEKEVSEEQMLNEDTVKELLDLTDVDLDNVDLESMDRSDEVRDISDIKQDVDNRRPLDPALRQSVLVRDNFSCQCCGVGGEQNLPILAVHHIVEVSQGGLDIPENLVTVCVNCHIRIHTYSWGKLYVDLDSLTDDEKKVFKKIFKYGNIIIEADKRLGRVKSKDEYKASVRHPFPTELLNANKKALEVDKSKD